MKIQEPIANERTIYSGNPSAVSILGWLVLCVALFLIGTIGVVVSWKDIAPGTFRTVIISLPLVPLLVFYGKWIGLNFLTYEITTERVKVIKGLFVKRTDELELYRVKDTSLVEPFIARMFSVGDIIIATNDASTPSVELRAIKNVRKIREELRTSIEECRTRKRAGIVELE